jgi:hypothetical protein
MDTAWPRANRSPARMSGNIAVRADWNGAPSNVTTASSTITAASGILGSTMRTTSAARARSQPIITARRGSRSAMSDSRIPPRNVGTMVATYVTAASRAERVWLNTSTVSATRANWSPATDVI